MKEHQLKSKYRKKSTNTRATRLYAISSRKIISVALALLMMLGTLFSNATTVFAASQFTPQDLEVTMVRDNSSPDLYETIAVRVEFEIPQGNYAVDDYFTVPIVTSGAGNIHMPEGVTPINYSGTTFANATFSNGTMTVKLTQAGVDAAQTAALTNGYVDVEMRFDRAGNSTIHVTHPVPRDYHYSVTQDAVNTGELNGSTVRKNGYQSSGTNRLAWEVYINNGNIKKATEGTAPDAFSASTFVDTLNNSSLGSITTPAELQAITTGSNRQIYLRMPIYSLRADGKASSHILVSWDIDMSGAVYKVGTPSSGTLTQFITDCETDSRNGGASVSRIVLGLYTDNAGVQTVVVVFPEIPSGMAAAGNLGNLSVRNDSEYTRSFLNSLVDTALAEGKLAGGQATADAMKARYADMFFPGGSTLRKVYGVTVYIRPFSTLSGSGTIRNTAHVTEHGGGTHDSNQSSVAFVRTGAGIGMGAPFSVEITKKINGTTTASLDGFQFKLQKKSGTDYIDSGHTGTTDTDGKLVFSDLAVGEYRIVETGGPSGYDYNGVKFLKDGTDETEYGAFTIPIDSDGAVYYTAVNFEGDPVPDPVYDAALRKWVSKIERNGSTVSTHTEPTGVVTAPKAQAGDKVTFSIRVINQGDTAVKVYVEDYMPAGYSFASADNADWTLSGGQLRYNNAIELDADEEAVITLVLTIKSDATAAQLKNFAEIYKLTDLDDNDVTDIDSTPDSDDTNDDFEDADDNKVGENGKNGGDEDDHDVADVDLEDPVPDPEYDAALRKWVSKIERGTETISTHTEPTGVVTAPKAQAGDKVTFSIRVINQGDTAVKAYVEDYMPAGYTLAAADNADWTLSGGQLRYNNAIELDADEEAVITLVLTIKSDATATQLKNFAEIYKLTDLDDNDVTDIDSTPDSDDANDDFNDNDDNKVGENGKNGGDEDDHDAAIVDLESTPPQPRVVYDAALRKWVSKIERNGSTVSTHPEPTGFVIAPSARVGDKVTFSIRVINQGNTAVKVYVEDYMPAGYSFSVSNNVGWTLSGGQLRYDHAIVLNAGESKVITLVLTIKSNATAAQLKNFAEIYKMTDLADIEVTDIDSTPDSYNWNDGFKDADDNKVGENGKSGGDEDDHDVADIILETRIPTIPKTGDESSIIFPLLLALSSMTMIALIIVGRKKRKYSR